MPAATAAPVDQAPPPAAILLPTSPPPREIRPESWRDAVPTVGALQHLAAPLARAAKKPASRSLDFIASDETQDRYGDVIRADGWDLTAFRRNPVVLWAHQDRSHPIGRVSDIHVKGTQLIATVDFLPEGESDFADKSWRLVEQKVINAVSVGFIPTKPPNVRTTADGQVIGYEFTAQELLELSLVSVPANPNALAVGRSFGNSDDALRSQLAALSCRDGSPQGDFSKQRAQAREAAIAARRRRSSFF